MDATIYDYGTGLIDGAYFVLLAAWYVLVLVAGWKLYAKMGESGWKSLIPVYRSYVMYRAVWQTKMFWIYVLCLVLQFIPVIGMIPGVAAIVISIMLLYKLSKAFRHGAGFTVGLVFLQPIFLLILGFGSASYRGNDN